MPIGSPIHQILDIKLAMYCPLIPKMGPGILVTCADVLLLYNLGDNWDINDDLQFSRTGFTALAHPSPIKVGTTHGVYVIKDVDKVDAKEPVQMCECLEVLQKPSEEVMHQKGAVLESENLCFGNEIEISGDVAYTDSSFFFSHDVTRKMKAFIESQGDIECEIDAYGDFLQALGPRATSHYIHNTSNVSTVTPNLLETRKAVFDLLKGTELSILVMNSSRFYHVGTTKEYIQNFCCDKAFQEGMGLSMNAFNLWTGLENGVSVNGFENGNHACEPDQTETVAQSNSMIDSCQGCVMQCILPKSSTIASQSVVEYSHFTVPVHVGQNTIVCNCEFAISDKRVELTTRKSDIGTDCKVLKIPGNIFLHTIPIRIDNETKYVTVCFDINDNLKKVVIENDFRKLPYLGKFIEDYSTVFDVEMNVLGKGTRQTGSKVSLWFTDLFPVVDTMTESLTLALEILESFKQGTNKKANLRSYQLVSIATALKKKDVYAMLMHRNKLFNKIRVWVPE